MKGLQTITEEDRAVLIWICTNALAQSEKQLWLPGIKNTESPRIRRVLNKLKKLKTDAKLA